MTISRILKISMTIKDSKKGAPPCGELDSGLGGVLFSSLGKLQLDCSSTSLDTNTIGV